jgi:membrane fusion protein, multidrug efflux system
VYDQRASSVRLAAAEIEAAQALITESKLSLDYAQVKAPIAGRVGRAELTVGNVVEAGPSAPVLTTVVANAQLYAEFEVDEQTYLRSMRTATGGEISMPVQLRLGSDAVTYQGTIQSFDNQIDARSGTIRARAVFDNADGVLVPGMFATVRVASSSNASAVLVSERYVGTDTGSRFVLLVDKDNKVERRPIVLGASVGNMRIATSGLKDGEKIITSGLMMLQPGMPVQPSPMPVVAVAR